MNKTTRKPSRYLALLLVLLLCVVLIPTGCTSGGGEESSAPDTSFIDDITSNVTGATDNDGTENSTTVTVEQGTAGSTTGSTAGTTGGTGGKNTTTKNPGGSGNSSTVKVTVPADLGKGKTYYVSSSGGNDSNDGLSPDKPFKTTAAVNELWLQPGDNVLFKRGDTFTDASLQIAGSGNQKDGEWVTIDAYGTGAKPVFKRAVTKDAAISFSKTSATGGYRIRNLDIDGYLGGIVSKKKTRSNSLDGLIIDNCSITNITQNMKYGKGDVQYPEGMDVGYGLFFRNVRNATIKNLSIVTTDVPIHYEGELTTFNNIYCSDSRITGVLLYGVPLGDTSYDAVMEAKGQIVFENARILYTGSNGYKYGTTGMMLENLRDSVVRNVEVGYSVNGTDDIDGNGITLENLNINTTLQNIYAHDNDGPFLLAMEHADTQGYAKNNQVLNCISVNNGKRSNTLEGSFINQSMYYKAEQKLIVRDCIDVGSPGSVAYKYDSALKTTFNTTQVSAQNFTSGTMDVYGTFDTADLSAFTNTSGASVSGGHLALKAGSKVRTLYTGSDYIVSSWLKGDAELVFMASDTDNGYVWDFQNGKVIAQKMSGGKLTKLKEIAVAALKTTEWFRVRVQVSGGTINTYIGDVQVDTLTDKTFTSGTAGVNASGGAQADEFFVYKYANKARLVTTASLPDDIAPGGRLLPRSMSGSTHQPEVNWMPSLGIGEHYYYPPGMAHSEVIGSNAYLQSSYISANVDGGYNKLHISMINGTKSEKLYVDFSTDGGKTWHTKEISVAAMSTDNCFPFKAQWPGLKTYTVDMSDMAQWSGTINGLRVRTGGTSGFISLQYVIISK